MLRKIGFAIAGILAFLCILSSVIYTQVTNARLMEQGFLSYARTEEFPVSPRRYAEYAQAITDYLSGKAERMTVQGEEAFSDKENLHMQDVRGLVRLLNVLRVSSGALVAALLLLLLLRRREDRENALLAALRGLTVGACFWVLLSAIIGILAWLDFDGLFIAFHRLFFRNDLWLLNPHTDLLLALMPTELFVWYLRQIALALLQALLLAAALPFALRAVKKQTK